MEYNKIRFAIVGGGTAGWITALKIRKYFPENDITVIESSEIGILGAGEGTTPHFVTFLREVDINVFEFINETKATFKTGIKFNNWHGDGSYYYHPFDDLNYSFVNKSQFLGMIEIAKGRNLNCVSLSAQCSENNCVPFPSVNYDFDFNTTSFALHFDARLTANYLKSVALSRGINLIDSIVVNTTTDDKKNITSIVLENNYHVKCDFVFDCTGFKRMFIGEMYKSKWLDYQDSLPVDRALPFFIQNNTDSIPPYTEAIAMKYGWVWKIPVQGRFGCGYVFDSSYVSDEEITKEIREMFGDVEIPRFFSFKAGYYENTWVNNCIAIGLSSGFIEPLEATSIWVSIMSLHTLIDICLPAVLNTNNTEYKNVYNKKIRDINSEIKDFLQLHYLTTRTDSKFWQEYKTKNKISKKLNNENVDTIYDFINNAKTDFGLFSPYYVNAGVKFFNEKVFKKHVEYLLQVPEYSNANQKLIEFKHELKEHKENKAMDHYTLLEKIKNIRPLF